MKKFLLLYTSLFLFIYCSFVLNMTIAKYILCGFISFQFIVSLGTFLLDQSDLKEIYQHTKKIPLIFSLSLDLIFIACLFYFNQTIFATLWFAQSFLINNTYVKAQLLFEK